MSIRTRSETTARHARRGIDRLDRRLAPVLVAAGLALAVLSGCGEGTASDAERGKAVDAQKTSVVTGMQATQSSLVLEPGTPPPATPTTSP